MIGSGSELRELMRAYESAWAALGVPDSLMCHETSPSSTICWHRKDVGRNSVSVNAPIWKIPHPAPDLSCLVHVPVDNHCNGEALAMTQGPR